MTETRELSAWERAWRWWVTARLLRWGLATLVILVGIWLTLPGAHVICRDELANVGKNAVVRTCGPLGVTDLPVVCGILLLVVLLGPDLSEVSIGVLTLKRSVEDTQRGQEEIRGEVEGLKQAFTMQASTSAEQTTSVATSVQAPDLAGVVREIARAVSSNPALAGAEEYAGDLNPRYASILGKVVLTLARLEFLLGSRALGKFAGGGGGVVRFWVVELGGPDMMTLFSKSEAFVDLAPLISDKEPAALAAERNSFRLEYADVLAQLGEVRQFAINGVITLSAAESTLENARALLGALSIRLKRLPRAESKAAPPKKVAASRAKGASRKERPEAMPPST